MPSADPYSAEILYGTLAAISMLLTLCVSGLTIYKLTRRQPKIEEYVDDAVSASEERTNRKIDELKVDLSKNLRDLKEQGETRVIRIHARIDDQAAATHAQIASLSGTVAKGFSDLNRSIGQLEGRGNG